MKKGFTVAMGCDSQNHTILRVTKNDGSLTLADIEDLIRCEESGRWLGRYVVILDCSEAIAAGEEFPAKNHSGYAEDLVKIEQDGTCPVCGKLTPPFVYCPTCGTLWEDMNTNAETVLASMKEQTERLVAQAKTRDSRLARYWAYIGALDMTRKLGFITDRHHQALCENAKTIRRQAEEMG